MRRVVVVVALVACGKSPPPPAPAPAPEQTPPAPSCRELYDFQVERNLAVTPEAKRADSKPGYDELKLAAISRCETKAYSADLRTCLHAAIKDKDPHDQSGLNGALALCHRTELLAQGIDMAGPTCDDVVAHLVAQAGPSGTEDQARAMVTPTCPAFTRAMKECLVTATEPEAMMTCLDLAPL